MSKQADVQETILVVEDDPVLRMSLKKTLRSAGYAVITAATGPEGYEAAAAGEADLVLLDVMLPGLNGFEVCQRIRAQQAELPILMVTAKGEEEDKVRGLGLGADDYVVKPFGVSELLARVAAALRRQRLQRARSAVLQLGDVTVDYNSHCLIRNGVPQEVTAQEMKLLRYFIERDGLLLTRRQILDGVWGYDYYGTDRTVDNFINRLRAKIEQNPKNPRHLVTVRGMGYRFSRQG